MKKIAYLFLLFAFVASAQAQNISVKSFKPLPMDMTATSLEGKRIDQNGQVAALIRVVTTETGFAFEGGTLGIVDTQQKTGEIWVWVPRAARKISIMHQKLGVLRDYRFPVEIESERTYEMVLTTGKVTTKVEEEITKQYLLFLLDPPNATLEVNDKLWNVGADGTAMKYVDFGSYTYRVRAADYITDAGVVTVDDQVNTVVVPVKLKPNFAQVTLKVDADAEIWVNNEKKGVRTWTGALGSDTYKVECKQANHETSVASIEITPEMNGQTITLAPPAPIYGSLNVESTPNLATIYIDGKEVGKTPKSIPQILIGQHELKLSKEGYADYVETITVAKGERKQISATMSNGKEIQFTCNAPGAQLEIDGQRVGFANGTYQLTNGSHSLRATATDYHDYSYTLMVSDAGNSRHNITMQAIRRAPKGALEGVFSVSPTQKVHFAKGNLQYQASTRTWRFAENQWDYIGKSNKNISSSYNGWIDLFGWGTGNNPTKSSGRVSDYNNFTDWGSKIDGDWRTLTAFEWKYVFDERETSSGIRYAKAKVNGVNGVILLPDNWNSSTYRLRDSDKNDANFGSNRISASEWNSTFVPAGAVFLPATGIRIGYSGSVERVGSEGFYWSTSSDGSYGAYVVSVKDYLNALYTIEITNGISVRLACPAKN